MPVLSLFRAEAVTISLRVSFRFVCTYVKCLFASFAGLLFAPLLASGGCAVLAFKPNYGSSYVAKG